MYTQPAIDALVARIGWDEPAAPTSIVLDSANTDSTSGRTFSNFHPLAVVENIEMTMPIANITTAANPDNTALNAFLLKMKTQAALQVLSRIFDTDASDYKYCYSGCRVNVSAYDWTDSITGKAGRLDNAYGYQLAYNALSMMLTTGRSNFRERAISDKGLITADMNGARNSEGKVVIPGLLQKLEDAFQSAYGSFFPAATKKPIARFVQL